MSSAWTSLFLSETVACEFWGLGTRILRLGLVKARSDFGMRLCSLVGLSNP